jgi:hypothetical protein
MLKRGNAYERRPTMKTTFWNITACAALTALVSVTSGCANMNHTQQRMLSGSAIGAGVGAVGTVMTGGCVSCGAAIGAAAGAGAGYIYDQQRR